MKYTLFILMTAGFYLTVNSCCEICPDLETQEVYVDTMKTGDIIVILWDFAHTNGNVILSLYNNENGWPDNKSFAVSTQIKCINENIVDGEVSLNFTDINYGTYAIRPIHDENGNNEFDTNFIGIPEEGFGASNDAEGNFGPPSYDASKFLLNSMSMTLKIKLRYP